MKTWIWLSVVGVLVVALLLAGVWLNQTFLRPLDKVSDFLLHRDREAAARYHKAQSDLKSQEDRHRAVLAEASEKLAEVEQKAIRAQAKITQQRNALKLSLEALNAKEVVTRTEVVEKIQDNPELLKSFNEYVEVSEERISNLKQDNALLLQLLDYEKGINQRLRDRFSAQTNVLNTLEKRFKLAEEEIDRLSGKKLRMGPGCVAGAASDIAPVGRNLRPAVACGVSLTWG